MSTEVLYVRIPIQLKREVERHAALNGQTLAGAAALVIRLGLISAVAGGGLLPPSGPEIEEPRNMDEMRHQLRKLYHSINDLIGDEHGIPPGVG